MYFKYRNTLHTPQKMQKIAEIKNIPYFLPVVYLVNTNTIYNNTSVILSK